MKNCEFCSRAFSPRPQVKNPRACNAPVCQAARQRSNEKDWHSRQAEVYDADYHRLKRVGRGRRIQALAERLLACLRTGALLLGADLDFGAIGRELHLIFFRLGIRRLNKFCKA